MFSCCDEAVQWIISRRKKDHSQDHFKAYIEQNNPAVNQLKVIHVAGTNGKGSTCSFISECLMCAGYRVGVFTSPHLVAHQDRITINHQWISDEAFLRIANQRVALWEKWNLAMFEIDVDIMMLYFLEEKVDYVVLETGLGGLEDATNCIENPLISVIVSIGLDHTERLGDTIDKIAYHKAGIIKENGLAVAAYQNDESHAVIEEVAKSKQASLHWVRVPEALRSHPITFTYRNELFTLSSLAQYQIHNACVAIETLYLLKEKKGLKIDLESIQKGILKSHWAGRFDILQKKPSIIVDGAHNEHGVSALIQSMKCLERPLVLVFAALKDKKYEHMIKALHQEADEMMITSFDFYRAANVEMLNTEEGLEVQQDWKKAIELACDKTKEKGTVLITGSLYFISEVIAYLKKDEK